MNHRKTLIGLIVFFFLVWFVIPLLIPSMAGPIYLVTLPARQLGIFVHEMGHGLFTLVSGGQFHWFQMEIMRGGVAVTSGGWRVLTLLGGLLGPAIFGALLLMASTRSKTTKPVMICVCLFFMVGIYYMLKPLFLSKSSEPLLQNWHSAYLLSLCVPGLALLIVWKIWHLSDRSQRLFLQILGILMCYAGFSDTRYIFHYEQLANGLYSDARVVASLFWVSAETVPFWLFFITSTIISVLNLGLMIWGTHAALRKT